MKYPNFLKNNDTIGICAPSSGVGYKENKYNLAINNLNKYFQIKETLSVRNNNIISNTNIIRANEFNDLINDNKINSIMCATGGDFLIDILPFIDYKKIKKNPKWILGYSDPTNLLYTITTNLDIATIYGQNASSFSQKKLHESLINTIKLLQGELITQNSFKLYEKEKNKDDEYNLTEKVYWQKINTEKNNFEGRIIGGCLDCILNILGTKFDGTKKFIKKYKRDKIIWYFDIFSLSSADVYRTLWQMKELGYFKHTDLIIIGRIKYPNTYNAYDYEEVLKLLFNNDIPIIFNADIGHVAPKITIINGAIAKIYVNNGKGKIDFILK